MTPEPAVRREQSGDPLEEAYGFAHAVAAGDRVLVSGTLPVVDGEVRGEGSPYEQALLALRNALAALEPFGLGAESVVRTRLYLSHARDADDVGRAHAEVLGAVRPAATMLVVAGFTDSRVLVEVEIEAFRAPREDRAGRAEREEPEDPGDPA
ncbi:Rid family hydrolase [Streptomyces sp. NPDC020983]|uniref:Rid family hydrolase n=1 Tax=Streptomyces sp. NPDC020983 TaxID=3365106 RepID=UPI0037B84415